MDTFLKTAPRLHNPSSTSQVDDPPPRAARHSPAQTEPSGGAGPERVKAQLVLRAEPVNVRLIVESVARIIGGCQLDDAVRWNLFIEPFDGSLMGDSTRIQQALLGYVANAARYTERGAITIRAFPVQVDEDGVLARFEVQDTGIGIAPELLEGLFQSPGDSEASPACAEGRTRIGLATTKALATRMGGSVGVRSVPGVGSTFWFTARLGFAPRAEGADASTADSAPARERLGDRCRGRRVLLAEGDEGSRDRAAAMLREAGLEAEVVADGHQAAARALATHYDLILMDLRTSGIDGPEVARRIRTFAANQYTPIVAIAANATGYREELLLLAGITDFLPAPVQAEELYAVLLRWLRVNA